MSRREEKISAAKDGVLCCPVCGSRLEARGGCMKCAAGHSYDISREGYVNLLMSNQSSARRHGDDRAMVAARTAFLDGEYYAPIAGALAEMTLPFVDNGEAVIDIGCGDGWYSARLLEKYAGNGLFPEYVGIDISKAALRAASRRNADMTLAVASAHRLPLADRSCGAVLCVFSAIATEEFARVLKKGGMLFTVTALPRHLYGLKRAVYDKPYENAPDDGKLPGFALREQRNVEYTLTLRGDSILRLFMMTPYYYKTSREDQSKLDGLEELETEVSVAARRYEVL